MTVPHSRERTFNLFANVEEHAQEVHGYLKYLKFGYGRATDDATTEIRRGRMTREEGMALAKRYDPVHPKKLQVYLDLLDLTEEEFFQAVEDQRDPDIWEKGPDGKWRTTDAVWRQPITEAHENARVPQISERCFDPKYRHMYWPIDDYTPVPDPTPPIVI